MNHKRMFLKSCIYIPGTVMYRSGKILLPATLLKVAE